MNPQDAVACSAVHPSLSLASMSAPFSTRNRTIDRLSSMQACMTPHHTTRVYIDPFYTNPLLLSPATLKSPVIKGQCVTCISSSLDLHLGATGCHLLCGMTRCYLHPTQVNTSRLNPSQADRYSIYLPRKDGKLSWPMWFGLR